MKLDLNSVGTVTWQTARGPDKCPFSLVRHDTWHAVICRSDPAARREGHRLLSPPRADRKPQKWWEEHTDRLRWDDWFGSRSRRDSPPAACVPPGTEGEMEREGGWGRREGRQGEIWPAEDHQPLRGFEELRIPG